MHHLNQAATFAASIVLTVFGLTCWFFEGRPFDPPMKAEQAAYVARQSDNFGGMFGVRGPHSLHASAEAKLVLRRYQAAHESEMSDYLVPVSAVSR